MPDLAHERAMRPMLLHLMRAVDSESRGLDMQDRIRHWRTILNKLKSLDLEWQWTRQCLERTS